MEFIRSNPMVAMAIAAVVGYLLLTFKSSGSSTAVELPRQLPTIVPVERVRTSGEAFAALDVVVAALRSKGVSESEIQATIGAVAAKLYSPPPPAV